MSKRPSKLPIIILTGASGIVGRHFIKAFRDDAYIYAIARRSQKSVKVDIHRNVHWMRADIAIESSVVHTFDFIQESGGADYIVHLAGYYDFENKPHPEFERTNVKGTEIILQNAKRLGIKRFIFASSITVTEFKTAKDILNEKSPANATFPYAESKRKCEHMVSDFSKQFPCTVVRLSAVFSDWCEYGPLYNFLTTWLSHQWKARILGGKGTTAIPYIHIRNLNSFFAAIIRQSSQLPDYHILVAGHKGYTSHKELYNLAVTYNFGHQRKPIFMPKLISAFGLISMDVLGRIINQRPFEKPWMIKYIDTQMNINPTASHELLNWKPIPRYHIMRRLIFLIENMKANPYQWDAINFESLHKRTMVAPNLIIYEQMFTYREDILKEAVSYFYSPQNEHLVAKYQKLPSKELYERLAYLLTILKTAIRTGDRFHALEYAKRLAVNRFAEDYSAHEVKDAIDLFGQNIIHYLKDKPELQKMDKRINDEIGMTIRLICDEVEDSFDRIMGEEPA